MRAETPPSVILRNGPGGKILKNCENVWKSAKKCEKVPRRFCPSVVALSFSLTFSVLLHVILGPVFAKRGFRKLEIGYHQLHSNYIPCWAQSCQIKFPGDFNLTLTLTPNSK